MRVLITGGQGRVGTPVSQKFVENGWDVRVISVEPESKLDGITYTQCNILDFAAVKEQVQGCDAIVHLAAIPSTLSHPSPELFNINVSGTYNVYQAAADAGIKRVVQASSINALGSYWGCDDRQFDYFPLNEDHPLYTTDAYSFSKQMVEDIAAYYWRRDGISSASFRFPGVWTKDMVASGNIKQRVTDKRQKLEEFINLPQAEQDKQLANARDRALQGRASRIMEYDARQSGLHEQHMFDDDWLWSIYFFDRYNYWSYIHTDDSTQAIEKAITADYEGAHPLFVNSDVNYLNYDSETLLRVFFPDVTERSKLIQGADTLVSYDKARDLLGYEPMWRLTYGESRK
jgi:nucleoside-diphosphate-sugar epimerase